MHAAQWCFSNLKQYHHSFIYRRCSSESAEKLLQRLDNSGRPVLLCLTHADKLYGECLKMHGKDCSEDVSKRMIAQEFEVGKLKQYRVVHKTR